jgi:hypothetical protein
MGKMSKKYPVTKIETTPNFHLQSATLNLI